VLCSAHTFLPTCLVKHLECLCKMLTSLQQNFTHTHCSSSSFIVTLSLIRRTAFASAQFSWYSSTTNAHSETGQMAVCCQNVTLGVLSSRSVLSVLVGTLSKKFGLSLNTPLYIITKTLLLQWYAHSYGRGFNKELTICAVSV